MKRVNDKLAGVWMRIGTRFLPFADAATPELPLPRLLRLSLFQFTVGMAVVLLIGTLNRVMIVELAVPASLVAVFVAVPLVFAPFRALVGFRSDTHRSLLGWRRVPFLWFGSLLQFSGFAIMPFALITLSGDSSAPPWVGHLAAGLAFLLVGAGLHTVQTVGMALATDLAPKHARPKVVALLCMMLLVGMVTSALVFGLLLSNFSQIKLIQSIQGAAVLTMLLNLVALWKQEPRAPSRLRPDQPRPGFIVSWRTYLAGNERSRRHLTAVGLGTAAFSMGDILLEPYGGMVLRLSVSATTVLTAVLAVGSALGLVLAARLLGRGADAYRVAAVGTLGGLVAFVLVIIAAPLHSVLLFGGGTALIGFGAGMFAHGTLTASMNLTQGDESGMSLGAWGAVQASAAGLAIAAGGLISDFMTGLGSRGVLGAAMTGPASGYITVYVIEIGLLFMTLAALGPLVRTVQARMAASVEQLQLNEMAR
ncbi:MAG: MFS transporter [Hyphomicrobiaceae bacterium]